jgi:hypothetical protein
MRAKPQRPSETPKSLCLIDDRGVYGVLEQVSVEVEEVATQPRRHAEVDADHVLHRVRPNAGAAVADMSEGRQRDERAEALTRTQIGKRRSCRPGPWRNLSVLSWFHSVSPCRIRKITAPAATVDKRPFTGYINGKHAPFAAPGLPRRRRIIPDRLCKI